MANLPFATHRYLIEPLTGHHHMSITLIRNFINFINSIRNSKKSVLKQLYNIVKCDTRTTTGSNLRNILTQTNLPNVDSIDMSTVHQLKYKEIPEEDTWRIPFIKEAIDIKYGLISPPDGWSTEELDELLHHACTV